MSDGYSDGEGLGDASLAGLAEKRPASSAETTPLEQGEWPKAKRGRVAEAGGGSGSSTSSASLSGGGRDCDEETETEDLTTSKESDEEVTRNLELEQEEVVRGELGGTPSTVQSREAEASPVDGNEGTASGDCDSGGEGPGDTAVIPPGLPAAYDELEARATIEKISADVADIEKRLEEKRFPRLRLTWSEEEEKIFIEAHKRLGNRWVEIAKVLRGRDARSVTNHWYNSTKNASKKGSLLRQYRISLMNGKDDSKVDDKSGTCTLTFQSEGKGSGSCGGSGGSEDKDKWEDKKPDDATQSTARRNAWTLEEDEIFVKAHKDLGNNWAGIAKRLPGRNYHAVYYHWEFALTRKSVSPLQEYRKSLLCGPKGKDSLLAQCMGLSSGSGKDDSKVDDESGTCSLAFLSEGKGSEDKKPDDATQSTARRNAWTLEEDEIFVKAHKDLGNNWAGIAKRLPGRNYHAVYYHWEFALTRKSVSPLQEYRKSLLCGPKGKEGV
ncbi:hypothetical protein HOP50_19g83790 [Chloropicon primus]|nr:hypothetical protein HOP50_19g83790 [Chloropicon primus]